LAARISNATLERTDALGHGTKGDLLATGSSSTRGSS